MDTHGNENNVTKENIVQEGLANQITSVQNHSYQSSEGERGTGDFGYENNFLYATQIVTNVTQTVEKLPFRYYGLK